jgi:AcrR family transcriptional regulator
MASTTSVHVPIQARSVRTRSRLLDAAREEFAERGYVHTNAKTIAHRAGTGTGTFYRYFSDKDAVLHEIARERVQAFRARVEPLSRVPSATAEPQRLVTEATSRIRKLVDLYVGYHQADRGLHAVLTERRLSDPEIEQIMTRSEKQAMTDIASLLTLWGYDGDAEAAALMWFSLLDGAVHAQVLGGPILTDDRFATALVEALLRIALPSHLLMLR